MKVKIYLSFILLVVLIVYITTCRRAGIWLVKNNIPIHADALVILMGSIPDRALHAADLFRKGMVTRVLIVEGYNDAYSVLKERGADMISGTVQLRNAAIALGIPADSITILPGNAQSTQHEALIIQEYITIQPDIDTLLLVSSAHHTRRASMIFKNSFRKSEKPVYIFCSPSPYSNFNPEKWWRNKEWIQVVLMEYVKIANFVLFERRKL